MGTVVLIPGWHENVDDMRVFIDGRRGKPGLSARGFRCAVFPEGRGPLLERIERFGRFLDALKQADPAAFPVATLGYSAGGLVNRGFLRAYPERAGEIGATFQLATPNAGIPTDALAVTLRVIRMKNDAIDDLDVTSDFLRWLNGTSGRWVASPGVRGKQWVLDAEPWVFPAAAPLLHVAGRAPRYALDGDGLVSAESATLSGRVPHVFCDGPNANHLNLGGVWNPLAFMFRGWRGDDAFWPRVVAIAADFFTAAGVAQMRV